MQTVLQGPAEVFKILTEINSNGFPGVEIGSDKQTNDSSEVEANRNGAGEGQESRLKPGIVLHWKGGATTIHTPAQTQVFKLHQNKI